MIFSKPVFQLWPEVPDKTLYWPSSAVSQSADESVFPRRCSHPRLVTEHPSSYLPSFALSSCPSFSFSSGRRWLLVYVQVLGSGLALRWWRPCCPASPCSGSCKSSRASLQTCRSSTFYTSSSTDPRPSQEPGPPDLPDPPDDPPLFLQSCLSFHIRHRTHCASLGTLTGNTFDTF